jgi:hypothetical protein
MVDVAESRLGVIQIVVCAVVHLGIVIVFLIGTKVIILFLKQAKWMNE